MKTRRDLFYAGTLPIRGMVSAIDPAALEAGEFQLLDNLTISRRKVTARWGISRLSGPPVAGASFRGAWAGYVGGIYTILTAYREGTGTRIYRVTSGLTYAVELTSLTTRFATDGFIDFAPYSERGMTSDATYLDPQDGVICGNGADEPGCVYYNGANFLFARVSEPVPSDNQTVSSQPAPSGYWLVKNASYTTFVNSGANFVIADSGASTTENELVVTLPTTAAVNDTSTVTFGTNGFYDGVGAALKLSEAKQFHIVIEDTVNAPIFDYLSIEVYNDGAATYHTVHTAGSTDFITTQVASGVYLISFNLGLYNADLANMTDLQAIRFTVAKAVSSNRTARILAIMTGGNVDGSALTAVSYLNSATRVESRRYVAENKGGFPVANLGGSDARNFVIPAPQNTYWKNWVWFINPKNTGSADYAIFHRKDPGDEEYFASSVFALTIIGTGVNIKRDNVLPTKKDYGRKAPSEFTVRPPKAKVWAAGSNRLFAGSAPNERQKVFVCDDGFPMRFVSAPRDSNRDGEFDADSGTVVAFPGEDVTRIVKMPGTLGISPMAVITNKSVYRLEGKEAATLTRPTQVAQQGTTYPWTVVQDKGNIFMLNSERKPGAVVSGYRWAPLGADRVEDQFESGDPSNAYGVFFSDRWYVAHRAPAASLNKRALVYDTLIDSWWRHSFTDPDIAGYVVLESGGATGRRLLGFCDTGEIFEFEKAGTTADAQKSGSNTDAVQVTLTTGELHRQQWERLVFGRVGVIAEASGTTVLTVTRSDPSNSGNPGAGVGTIVFDATPERTIRWDQVSGSSQPCAISSQSCVVSVTGNLTPGKIWTGLFIELEDGVRPGPDVKR